MKALLFTTMILTLGLAASPSHAALQSIHWKVDGDQKATLDTNTGIEWLDVSETFNKSVNEVISQMGAGGLYAGWRLPTESEVLGFINNHFNTSFNGTTLKKISGASTSQAGRDAYGPAKILYETMGATLETAQHNQKPFGPMSGWWSVTHAKYVSNDGVTVKFAGADYYISGGGDGYYNILGGYGAYNKDFKGDIGGYGANSVFLVSDGGLTFSSLANPMQNIANPNAPINNMPVAAVSAPLHIGGGLLALFALAGRTRRKQ